MVARDFYADCARCAGLCCVCLAFDASPEFAIDKALNTPCPHLGVHEECTIHSARRERGFAGCVDYDCLGAGQRVMHEVFAGRGWREQPDMLPSMCEAFHVLRQIQELRQLVGLARELCQTEAERLGCKRLLARLDPEAGWSQSMLSAFPVDEVCREVDAFLRDLRPSLPTRRTLPIVRG